MISRPKIPTGRRRAAAARERRAGAILRPVARHLAIRRLCRELRRDGAGESRRVLIVGGGEAGTSLAEELRKHFPGEYLVVGFVEDDPALIPSTGGKLLGGRQDLARLVQSFQIDEVMIADFLTGRLGGITGPCLAPPDDEQSTACDPPTQRPHIGPPPAKPRPGAEAAKRAFNILFSAAALIAGAPVALLASLAIRLTSSGPVLYRQERVGRDGRPFTIYKLRTMVDGAENGTGPVLARKGDKRSTPLGKVLRATKLDEWPQFYNVLRGDMSVVGPRPERLCFVQAFDRHIPSYRQRHTVRPGITGLAQVQGSYLSHVYVKLRYDLMYVQHRSLWLDLRILAQTPVTILGSVKNRNYC